MLFVRGLTVNVSQYDCPFESAMRSVGLRSGIQSHRKSSLILKD